MINYPRVTKVENIIRLLPIPILVNNKPEKNGKNILGIEYAVYSVLYSVELISNLSWITF